MGFSHEHLVQDARKRVDVRRRADRLVARRLLRAHVERGADGKAGLGEAVAARPHGQRDAEVGDQRLSAAQQDIARLDVTVNHAGVVGDLERARYRNRDPQRLVHRKLGLALDARAEGLALDVRHHVEEEAVRLTRIEERQDVGVLEVGRGLDLGQEALRAYDGREFGLENLDGDLAVVLEVLGQEDRGHAAFAELALNDVTVGQCRVQAVDGDMAHGQALHMGDVDVKMGSSLKFGQQVVRGGRFPAVAAPLRVPQIQRQGHPGRLPVLRGLLVCVGQADQLAEPQEDGPRPSQSGPYVAHMRNHSS